MTNARIHITDQALHEYLTQKSSLAPDMRAFLRDMCDYSGSSRAGYLELLEGNRKIYEECLALNENEKNRSHLKYLISLIKNFDLYVQIAVNERYALVEP
jgi:hypothetical protein